MIITYGHEITARAVIERCARWMTIGQRLAGIIEAFCVGALPSAVNLDLGLPARPAW